MEMGSPEKSFEELLDEYSSSADVEKALSEKQASLEEVDPINVKRDYPRPQDELDLHNFTGEEARRKTQSYYQGLMSDVVWLCDIDAADSTEDRAKVLRAALALELLEPANIEED